MLRFAPASLLCATLAFTTGCSLNDLLAILIGQTPGGERPCGEEAGSQGTLTANAGGDAFEGCTVSLSGAPSDSFVISATNADVVPSTLTITLSGAASPGEYKFGGETADGDDNGVFIKGDELLGEDESQASYKTKEDVESGTINLTKVDDTGVAGTFSFTATNQADESKTLEITDGAFDVSF